MDGFKKKNFFLFVKSSKTKKVIFLMNFLFQPKTASFVTTVASSSMGLLLLDA
jgi:hypothetical protein